MLLTRLAVAGAAALVLLAQPAPAVVPVSAPLQTLQIGTNGVPSGTHMTWICSSEASMHCADRAGPAERWTTTVTVPQGVQVWMAVEKLDPNTPGEQPDCWISDKATGAMLMQSRSHCLYQGPSTRLRPAPPSDT